MVKVREAKGGPVISFPIDRTGVHITYHPGQKPHLREGTRKGGTPGRILAEMDIDTIKTLTVEDFKSMFGYPSHSYEVMVIPVESLSALQEMSSRPSEPPYVYEVLFRNRIVYFMKGRSLKQFLHESPSAYLIVGPAKRAMLVYDRAFEEYGSIRWGTKRPLGNQRIRKLFELHYATINYLESLPDSEIDLPEPDEGQLSEWRERMELVDSEMKVYKWSKVLGMRKIPQRVSLLGS